MRNTILFFLSSVVILLGCNSPKTEIVKAGDEKGKVLGEEAVIKAEPLNGYHDIDSIPQADRTLINNFCKKLIGFMILGQKDSVVACFHFPIAFNNYTAMSLGYKEPPFPDLTPELVKERYSIFFTPWYINSFRSWKEFKGSVLYEYSGTRFTIGLYYKYPDGKVGHMIEIVGDNGEIYINTLL